MVSFLVKEVDDQLYVATPTVQREKQSSFNHHLYLLSYMNTYVFLLLNPIPKIHYHRIAKNLFKMLRQAKQEQKKKESKFNQNGLSTESYDAILGRHYQRKTRFRVPMVPMKLVKDDAHLFNIYGKLKCLDIAVSLVLTS